jgi:flavin reductase (DIM6/NTAB) family NADH-FMN oxidoreductase RutF
VTVTSPNPAWTPATPSPHPFTGPGAATRTYLTGETPGATLYPLVISAVIPRPIALVSSTGADGSHNLAPFSYFGVMAHDPPMLALGTCATSGRANRMKDTQQNVLETGEFVVNLVSEWMLEAANHTCGFYDRGVDELALAGLTPVPSRCVRPPRVGESAVQMECVLAGTHPVVNAGGVTTATILIGRVVAMHVLEGVLVPTAVPGRDVVDPARLAPVSRLGGDTYARITQVYDLPRPGKEWQERRAGAVAAAAAVGARAPGRVD